MVHVNNDICLVLNFAIFIFASIFPKLQKSLNLLLVKVREKKVLHAFDQLLCWRRLLCLNLS